MLMEKYIIGCVFCQHFTQFSQKHSTSAPAGTLKPAALYIMNNDYHRILLENDLLFKTSREN